MAFRAPEAGELALWAPAVAGGALASGWGASMLGPGTVFAG